MTGRVSLIHLGAILLLFATLGASKQAQVTFTPEIAFGPGTVLIVKGPNPQSTSYPVMLHYVDLYAAGYEQDTSTPTPDPVKSNYHMRADWNESISLAKGVPIKQQAAVGNAAGGDTGTLFELQRIGATKTYCWTILDSRISMQTVNTLSGSVSMITDGSTFVIETKWPICSSP